MDVDVLQIRRVIDLARSSNVGVVIKVPFEYTSNAGQHSIGAKVKLSTSD